MPLNLKSIESIRNALTIVQSRKVKKIYEQAASDLEKKILKSVGKRNVSAVLQSHQRRVLKKTIEKEFSDVNTKLEEVVKSSMKTVSTELIWCTQEWLQSVGFEQSNAFTHLPKQIVQSIATGQVYEDGFNLSKAIWSSNKKVQEDIYSIIAKGVAENSSVYEIAKEIEVYINPNKRLPWHSATYNGQTIRVYNRKVDYSAQRLARTLCQHAYQLSYQMTTSRNPFIKATRWVSNGSRACPLCKDRDGQIFEKGQEPLDHPNGMCTLEPIMSTSDDEIIKQIADWHNSPIGTYPELDVFAVEISKNK